MTLPMILPIKLQDKIEQLRPVNDFVLLRIKRNEVSAGGILLGKEKEKISALLSEVIAVGPGEFNFKTGERYPIALHRGQWVLSLAYSGQELQAEEEYRFMRWQGIIARIEVIEHEKRVDITAIHPLHDYILIEPEDRHETKSGIWIETRNILGTYGKVLDVGPGQRDLRTGQLHRPVAEIGKRCVYMRVGGFKIKTSGGELQLISPDEFYWSQNA